MRECLSSRGLPSAEFWGRAPGAAARATGLHRLRPETSGSAGNGRPEAGIALVARVELGLANGITVDRPLPGHRPGRRQCCRLPGPSGSLTTHNGLNLGLPSLSPPPAKPDQSPDGDQLPQFHRRSRCTRFGLQHDSRAMTADMSTAGQAASQPECNRRINAGAVCYHAEHCDTACEYGTIRDPGDQPPQASPLDTERGVRLTCPH